MTGSGRGGTGHREYRRNRAVMLAATDLCGICGHGGALTADHIVPDRAWPRDRATGRRLPGFDSLANLRPAHGSMGGRQPNNPCPTCGRMCNQSRGDRPDRRPQSRDWFPDGIPHR